MPAAPEFSSLIVSRPGAHAAVAARARALAVSALLYAALGAALVVAPFLVLDSVAPPRAAVKIDIFQPPPGSPHPAGLQPKGNPRGGGGDRKSAPRPKTTLEQPRAEAAPSLTPPAQNDVELPAGPGPGDDPSATWGVPDGHGDENGGPGGCDGCNGIGPPGADTDAPYQEGTIGLVPPVLVAGSRALPKYPDIARRAGLQGTVVLLVVVDKTGAVGTIEVVKNPDQRWGFDLSAIDAVKQWRYQPALMQGRPVAAYITVMVEFTLAR